MKAIYYLRENLEKMPISLIYLLSIKEKSVELFLEEILEKLEIIYK